MREETGNAAGRNRTRRFRHRPRALTVKAQLHLFCSNDWSSRSVSEGREFHSPQLRFLFFLSSVKIPSRKQFFLIVSHSSIWNLRPKNALKIQNHIYINIYIYLHTYSIGYKIRSHQHCLKTQHEQENHSSNSTKSTER
ncbi:hypothetical protein AB6A40_011450 [Gnathostoma spinigerum]|uniref:Uncharacterized protein n=1 Tax=Gnathostoma spinigerum TaxID=75299 RepID=A0ABD6EXU8_9BILA